MTTALDELEYMAWHLAAEPTRERMDDLLDGIRKRAPKLAGSKTRSPENVSEATSFRNVVSPAKSTEDVLRTSQGHLERISGNVPDVVCETSQDAVKMCNRCGHERGPLPLERFGKDKDRKDGHRGTCKDCTNKARRDRRVVAAPSRARLAD